MKRSKKEMCKDIVDVLFGTSYDNAMPIRDVAEICQIHESHVSCPRTRKLVKDAMKYFNVPIGAHNKGFYIIRTAQEMQRYLNRLLQIQIATSETIDITYEAFLGRHNIA